MEEIVKQLEERYFLIKKSAVWYFLGGAVAFLIAAFSISYSNVMRTINEQSGQQTKQELEANAKAVEKLLLEYQDKIKLLNQVEINKSDILSVKINLDNIQSKEATNKANFDSKWLPIKKGQELPIRHPLGEIPTQYTIYVTSKENINFETGKANVVYSGGDTWTHASSNGGEKGRGVTITDLTSSQIIIRAGAYAVYDTWNMQPTDKPRILFWNDAYVRVLLWK